ncbi:MAG: cystathionine beta-synthase [Bacteroidia bacterium]|nr:cystathionine beta-synthase [Bacteroidia bacterium]
MWYNNIIETIGNTPLVRLNSVTSHIKATVLAKVEYFNPGNSIKDRIALRMIEEAEKSGKLKPGGTIIEGTSGNTGMGLALVAAVKGYRCIFVIPDKQSKEKIDILRSVGAEVVVTPTDVEPEDPRSYYSVSKRLANEIPNSFYPNQYDNPNNTQAHTETTGPEIWAQTEGKITHFIAGMGTCGTICGVSDYLKSKNPAIQTVGIDTYGSLFQKLHETGQIDLNEVYGYLTEGIGEDFVPQNCNMSVIDKIIKVSDRDAATMARKLARLEGLMVGWSSGSAVHGALEYAKNLSSTDVVVVILPDHGTRYLGKIYNDVWMRDRGFLEDASLFTAADIITERDSAGKLAFLTPEHTLADAIHLMRSRNISQLPIINNGIMVGSINENRVLNILLDEPSRKNYSVLTAMNDPFPVVLPSTRIDSLSKMITRENPAVILQQPDGQLEIITRSDLINVLIG